MDNDPLLQAICAAPDDVHLRLVYADWLEDRGDPRADFIRVQCRLAEMDENDDGWWELKEEELRLLNRHGAGWVGQLNLTHRPVFRRGFVEQLTMPAAAFPEIGEHLTRLLPLRFVGFWECEGHLSELGHCPALARLSGLGLYGPGVSSELETVLASRYLEGLRDLKLNSTPFSLTAARALIQAKLGNLARLSITSSELGAAELELLAGSDNLDGLQDLDLSYTRIGSIGLHFISGARHLAGLRRLFLTRCSVGDGGVRALAFSPFLRQLQKLHLGNCAVTGEGLEAIASARWSELRTLDFTGNRVGQRALRIFTESQTFAGLRNLNFADCGVSAAALGVLLKHVNSLLAVLSLDGADFGDEGAKVLSQAATLKNLRELSLYQCSLSPWGLKDLLWSPHLVNLRALEVGGNNFDDRVVQVLATCPVRPRLTSLGLCGARIGNGDLIRLGACDNLPMLSRLDLSQTDFSDDDARTLAAMPLLGRLTHLDLGTTAISVEGIRALLASPLSHRLLMLGLKDIRLDKDTLSLVEARFFAQFQITVF